MFDIHLHLDTKQFSIKKGKKDDFIQVLDEKIKDCIVKTSNDLSCAKCSYHSTNRGAIQRHIEARHFETNGFTCEICNKIYKTHATLQKHLQRHQKENK